MVTEHDVLHHWLPGPDGLEEVPEVRLQIVIIVALETLRFESRSMAELRVVFRMPLLEVWLPQTGGQSVAVVARSRINTQLRSVAESKLGELDNAFGSHEARDFRSLRTQSQTHVYRDVCVFEKNGMHVWSVAPIFPAVDSAKCRRLFGSFVDSQNKLHSTEQMNQ